MLEPSLIEMAIPPDVVDRFDTLRPGRKVIILHYYQIYTDSPRSPHQIVPLIATRLGYKVDVNGSNSYLLKVIQEFFDV